MNIKQTVKELRWKERQLITQAARYGRLARELEELGGELPIDSESKEEEVTVQKKKKNNRRNRIYGKMEHRLRVSKNQKLRAEALEWFKKNHPDSEVLKHQKVVAFRRSA